MKYYYRILDCRHGKFIFNDNDTFVGKSLKEYGEYSEGEIHLLTQICKKGDNIIEVGSNIGAHTVPLAKLISNSGILLSFEPQKIVFQMLCKNLKFNNLKNVEAIQKAVSDKKYEKYLTSLSPEIPGNFGAAKIVNTQNNEEDEKIVTTTLDELLYARLSKKNNKLKLIKCDAEGSEKNILKGASKLIKKFKPFLYVENDNIEKSKELIELILNYNYILFWHIVPLFNFNNFFNNNRNIFHRVENNKEVIIASYNMFCMHVSNQITLNVEWKKFRINNSANHPLKKL